MTDLAALIAKLEAAPEGSRDLDTEIAVELGWSMCMTGYVGPFWVNPAGQGEELPTWTTSLDAKLPKENIRWSSRTASDRWEACAMSASSTRHRGYGATEPLARRAAALRAIQHERERQG